MEKGGLDLIHSSACMCGSSSNVLCAGSDAGTLRMRLGKGAAKPKAKPKAKGTKRKSVDKPTPVRTHLAWVVLLMLGCTARFESRIKFQTPLSFIQLISTGTCQEGQDHCHDNQVRKTVAIHNGDLLSLFLK